MEDDCKQLILHAQAKGLSWGKVLLQMFKV